MYNKIFTKILDSSIWLEPTPTRIVWLTMLAAMDEEGFCQFAAIPNLAHRAVLSIPETTEAVRVLESPDLNSSDPEHDGRRIERVPGGWMVLNAVKYRELVTRSVIQEQTRRRVAAYRDRKKGNATVTPVTQSNADNNKSNAPVTPSESDTDTKAEAKAGPPACPSLAEWQAFAIMLIPKWPPPESERAWLHYDSNGWKVGRNPVKKWESCCRKCHLNWKSQSYSPNGTSNSRTHAPSNFAVNRNQPEREDTSGKSGRLF